jgi:hypothetical protein
LWLASCRRQAGNSVSLQGTTIRPGPDRHACAKNFRFQDTGHCPRSMTRLSALSGTHLARLREVAAATGAASAHATDNACLIKILTYCRARA